MSQWGAEGYARHGYDFRRILAHYYPYTHLGIASPRTVRVLLLPAADKVRVGSSAPFLVVDARGRRLHLPARAVVVDRRLTLRHLELVPPLRFEPGAQPLAVDGAGYRGELVVKRTPGGLLAVNDVPLELYLRSVVPYELPTGWHDATYEAQAIAARSYALAMMHPEKDFDVYSDDRSQMYGGIRAEQPQTDRAVGATAGEVLVWHDTIIPAYYFSTSGGRTSSVHDAWPRLPQVPYLVSVADPYDYISPRHVWPTKVVTAAQAGSVLQLRDVRDLRVLENSSGRADAVRVLTARGWSLLPAQVVRERFALGSTDFHVSALSLDAPGSAVTFGRPAHLHGFLRGLGKARLEIQTGQGWHELARVHPDSEGRFSVRVVVRRSAQLRLAYNSVAGSSVPLSVIPRLDVRLDGTKLRALVSPRLPLEVQRLVRARWRRVARATGSFDGQLRPGSYRVTVPGSSAYAPIVSRPVGLHTPA
jgi:SpoIID/LytB domain protein